MKRTGARNEKLGIALVTSVVSALFLVPAALRTGGAFPAPLDDVYIHFDYARALAQGSPFAWIEGQGYSSGETAPLYAWLLSLGYLVGFRAGALGWFAAGVAVVSLYSGLAAAARLIQAIPLPGRLVGLWLLASASVAPFLFLSGMEGALHFACMMHAIVAGHELGQGGAHGLHPQRARGARLWQLGLLLLAMFLLRPESVALAWLMAVSVGRAQRGPSAWPAMARVLAPTAVALLCLTLLNLVFTGYPEAAGAKLKLLSSNPWLSNVDRAREVALNLFHFQDRALGTDLSSFRRSTSVLVGLGVIALLFRKSRGTAWLCLAGAVAFALLVSLNGAARFQNFRYYVPPISLLMVSALLGASRVCTSAAARTVVTAGLLLLACAAAPRVWSQSVYFARCARNIHELQFQTGVRVKQELPGDAIVLVGDAGAIPYASGLHAVDAVGLGGYHGVPFVLAATQGEAATIELVESLPESLRPTHMALFPNWFPETTRRFGKELFFVTVADNAISGGATKGVYTADWSYLAPSGETLHPNAKDEIDVANVLSERAHAYVSPAPFGGWTTMDVRDDGQHRARFEGGRIVPSHKAESFTINASGMLTLVARWDVSGSGDEDVPSLEIAGRNFTAPRPAVVVGAFSEVRVPLGEVQKGMRLTVRAGGGELRSYHYWLE